VFFKFNKEKHYRRKSFVKEKKSERAKRTKRMLECFLTKILLSSSAKRDGKNVLIQTIERVALIGFYWQKNKDSYLFYRQFSKQ
jgi:hypothetical protein